MARQNHRTRIYQAFRSRIQRGEIGPDDRLVDTVIAAELGVSRMPVREALMQLASEGYLEGTTRGFTLPSLGHARIMQIFTLRRLLEPHAAALAAQSRSDVQMDAMSEAVADAVQTLETGDITQFYRASEIFRNTWLGAVSNIELRQTILRYLAQVQSVRFATMQDPVAHRVIVAGQQELLDRFAHGDAVGAGERMLRFVLEAEQSYLRLSRADQSALTAG
ncbi:MAG: transcriptional regulator, GntR family [Rhodobacteraceae bacterium HLUCCA12]|nr:MAG: transcriptional regulator, GntR family [Rhodobacteraceae bacterium HLUCCA12]